MADSRHYDYTRTRWGFSDHGRGGCDVISLPGERERKVRWQREMWEREEREWGRESKACARWTGLRNIWERERFPNWAERCELLNQEIADLMQEHDELDEKQKWEQQQQDADRRWSEGLRELDEKRETRRKVFREQARLEGELLDERQKCERLRQDNDRIVQLHKLTEDRLKGELIDEKKKFEQLRRNTDCIEDRFRGALWDRRQKCEQLKQDNDRLRGELVDERQKWEKERKILARGGRNQNLFVSQPRRGQGGGLLKQM